MAKRWLHTGKLLVHNNWNLWSFSNICISRMAIGWLDRLICLFKLGARSSMVIPCASTEATHALNNRGTLRTTSSSCPQLDANDSPLFHCCTSSLHSGDSVLISWAWPCYSAPEASTPRPYSYFPFNWTKYIVFTNNQQWIRLYPYSPRWHIIPECELPQLWL